jgi:hypothetical protein
VLLRILDTALDDGEECLCLRFVEVRTQRKLCNLKIKAGTKWVPWHFEYNRILDQGIICSAGRWSIVGNVLIKPTTIWVKFDHEIVKGGMIWVTGGSGFES